MCGVRDTHGIPITMHVPDAAGGIAAERGRAQSFVDLVATGTDGRNELDDVGDAGGVELDPHGFDRLLESCAGLLVAFTSSFGAAVRSLGGERLEGRVVSLELVADHLGIVGRDLGVLQGPVEGLGLAGVVELREGVVLQVLQGDADSACRRRLLGGLGGGGRGHGTGGPCKGTDGCGWEEGGLMRALWASMMAWPSSTRPAATLEIMSGRASFFIV